jgi:hypothetical protein
VFVVKEAVTWGSEGVMIEADLRTAGAKGGESG